MNFCLGAQTGLCPLELANVFIAGFFLPLFYLVVKDSSSAHRVFDHSFLTLGKTCRNQETTDV